MNEHIVYIKLWRWVSALMLRKYGSAIVGKECSFGSPICLPWQTHPAGHILSTGVYSVAPGSTMPHHLSASSYMMRLHTSEEVLHPDLADDPYLRPACEQPTEADRKELYPFFLPPKHWEYGMLTINDDCCMLTEKDAHQFRAIMMHEFWNTFDEFELDYRINQKANGKAYVKEELKELFCRNYGISVDDQENFDRAYKRREKDMRERIKFSES